ncbi:MAG: serine/threonine-protein kinase [Pirellulaceae bacterium]
MRTSNASQPSSRVCPHPARLTDFLNGRLPPTDLESVAQHTESCARCQSFLDTQQASDDGVFQVLRLAADVSDFSAEPEFADLKRKAKQITGQGTVREEATRDSAQFSSSLSTVGGIKTDTWNRDTEFLAEDDLPIDLPGQDPLPEKIGKYFVLRELGRGGFARVYLAKDPQLNRLVAVKVPRPDRLNTEKRIERFLKEARTSASLDHPSIVQVYDWGRTDDGGCFVVMEYIEGCTLKELAKSERLAPRRVVEILIAVAQGLQFAHQRGIYHRDIKSLNILIDKQGRPHVADFGLALIEEDRWKHKYELAGTYAYMSPEQTRGEAHLLDGRTDVWSLGVVCYELLARRRPFRGRTGDELFEQILTHEPPPIASLAQDVPEELTAVCMKCLRKSLTERYQDAASVAGALRSLKVARHPAANLRRMLAAAGASLLLLLTAAAAVIAYHNNSQVEPSPPGAPGPPRNIDRATISTLEETPWTDVSLANWRNLLPETRNGSIEYQPQTNTLTLSSTQAMAIRLGALRASDVPYRLRVRITVQDGQTDYQSGLLLGFRPGAEADGGATFDYQEISVREKPERPVAVDRYRNTALINARGKTYIQPRQLVSHDFIRPHEKDLHPEKFKRRYDLEIGVDAQGLVDMRVNGAPATRLVENSVNAETSHQDYLGEFGILHQCGAVIVSNYQMKIGRFVNLDLEGEQP